MKEKLKEFNKTKDISCIENYEFNKFKRMSVKDTHVYFNKILAFRDKIYIFEKDIEDIILEEMKLFKEKYDNLKLINPKHSFQYDLIYAAMFGNGIAMY